MNVRHIIRDLLVSEFKQAISCFNKYRADQMMKEFCGLSHRICSVIRGISSFMHVCFTIYMAFFLFFCNMHDFTHLMNAFIHDIHALFTKCMKVIYEMYQVTICLAPFSICTVYSLYA